MSLFVANTHIESLQSHEDFFNYIKSKGNGNIHLASSEKLKKQ